MRDPAINVKKIAAEKALEYVRDGMILGLGTGSTAYWAILGIGELVKKGLQVRAVATSVQSETLAREAGIPIVPFSDIDHIDLTIDGADEVDENLNLIKGGGGALLREKIVAAATKFYIIIVDEGKRVTRLGKFPLPVEIAPFGWELTRVQLARLGCPMRLRTIDKTTGKWTTGPGGQVVDEHTFHTDNGHYILDCSLGSIPDPALLHQQVNVIPGVMDNGLFINMADLVITSFADGSTNLSKKDKIPA
jgi:ribose 5-phosphate isomerase A